MIQNLAGPCSIFLNEASWFPGANLGVFVSHWFLYAPMNLVVPMFGYVNKERYLRSDCRHAYQGKMHDSNLWFHGIRGRTSQIVYCPHMIGNYVNRPASRAEAWNRPGLLAFPDTAFSTANCSFINSGSGLPYLKLDKHKVSTRCELLFCYQVRTAISFRIDCFNECLNKDVAVLLRRDDCGVIVYPSLPFAKERDISSLVLLPK